MPRRSGRRRCLSRGRARRRRSRPCPRRRRRSRCCARRWPGSTPTRQPASRRTIRSGRTSCASASSPALGASAVRAGDRAAGSRGGEGSRPEPSVARRCAARSRRADRRGASPRGGGPDRAGFEALAEALERRRETARADRRGALAGAGGSAPLLDLSALVAHRGWLDPAGHVRTAPLSEPAEASARRSPDRLWKTVRKAARRLGDPDVEARHRLRKPLKMLRYGWSSSVACSRRRRSGRSADV